jgi:putative membrane protein
MIHYLVQLVVFALSVLLTTKVVKGITVRSFGSAMKFAFAVSLLNLFLWKILILLSFPLVVLTFGLFLIVINGFLFWLGDKLIEGVAIKSFGSAMLAGLVTGLINWGAMALLHRLW